MNPTVRVGAVQSLTYWPDYSHSKEEADVESYRILFTGSWEDVNVALSNVMPPSSILLVLVLVLVALLLSSSPPLLLSPFLPLS